MPLSSASPQIWRSQAGWCVPRATVKTPAGAQDQQASGFLVEDTHVHHVPSLQKEVAAPEPALCSSVTLTLSHAPALSFPPAAWARSPEQTQSSSEVFLGAAAPSQRDEHQR